MLRTNRQNKQTDGLENPTDADRHGRGTVAWAIKEPSVLARIHAHCVCVYKSIELVVCFVRSDKNSHGEFAARRIDA